MRKIITILFSALFLLTFSKIFAQGQSSLITQEPTDQYTVEGQTATFSVSVQPLDSGYAYDYAWHKNGAYIGFPSGASINYTTPPTASTDSGDVYFIVVTKLDTATGPTIVDQDTSKSVTLHVTASGNRVTAGLQVLYDFKEGVGDTIRDKSNVGTPFDLVIDNTSAVTWTDSGLGINDIAYINSDSPPTKIINAVQATNELTLEVWVKAAFVEQREGARIVTLSPNTNNTDFSLLQSDAYYTARVRTTQTDQRGEPDLNTTNGSADADLVHLTFTRSTDGTTKLYKNGTVIATDTVLGDFSNWNSSYQFQLANDNELQDPRQWIGTYYLVSVYNRALNQAEVTQNYSVGTGTDHAPQIIIQPQNQAWFVGESAFFTVNAVGDTPLTYQWKKNGADISGANSSTYSTPPLSLSDDGDDYSVSVTNGVGVEISRSAEVDVSDTLDRVTSDQLVLYNFQDATGDTIRDVSGYGSPLNLVINTPDSVQWKTNGLQVNGSPDIASETAASKVSNAINISGEFTFEMWVAPDNNSQIGNIFNIAMNSSNTNFTVDQFGQRFNTYLRTSTSNNDGFQMQSPAVAEDTLIHIVYIHNIKEISKIYVNGVEVSSTYLVGTLQNWNSSYPLKLAEQAITSSQWTGLLNLICVYDRALSNDEIAHNYSQGPAGYVLNAPTNLTANLVAPDSDKVELTWEDNTINELGYAIERRINTDAYSVIDTVAANDTSYVDESISDTTNYSYRVRAFDSLFVSAYSNEATIVSPLISVSAPTNLTAETNAQDSFKVDLNWTDNSSNETGFVVERKLGAASNTNSFEVIDSLAADQTSYTDSTVSDSTTYTYRIYAYSNINISGYSNSAQITTPILTGIKAFNQIPKEYGLSQNYPNPFNPSTTIRFAIPASAKVTIILYNTLGQKVAKIFDRETNAGIHEVNFNASYLSSGVYFYRLEAHGVDGNNFISTKRMMLLK